MWRTAGDERQPHGRRFVCTCTPSQRGAERLLYAAHTLPQVLHGPCAWMRNRDCERTLEA
eukprot:388889-Prymnesium_polylepis.2